MLRSRYFWKLFGTYAVLVVLTTLVVGYFVGRYIEHSQWDAKVDSLQKQCVLLSPYARGNFDGWPAGEDSMDLLGDLAQRNGIRVTFIQRDGLVVFDTAEDPSQMDNHLGRTEIQEALVSGSGTSQRFGRTLGEQALYVAHVPKPSEATWGVVRVSVRAKENIATPVQILLRTAPGASLAALLALILGYFGARRMTAPLGEMTVVAQAFQQGDYDQRIVDLPKDEIGDLGHALNLLGDEVQKRVGGLSAERARLSAMLAGMAEAVLAVGDEDRVSFSNPAAGRLFGTAEQDMLGSKLWDVAHMPGLLELINEARQSDRVVQRELVFVSGNHEHRLVANAHHFRIERSNGAVVVFEDITELRKLERVRQDFVANVSHELKTPLTSIRGYVETLLEGAVHDPDHNMRFLGKIEKNVTRLSDLVSDLLRLARIENQEGHLVRTEVNLCELLRDTKVAFEQQIEKAGLTLSLNLADEACVVWGEERGLAHVLENLLSNALKYTPRGGKIEVTLQVDGDGMAHMMVQDSGAGIPQADQGRIFERFYRVDKARSNEMGGTGLGLSIVKHQVQAMRGRVGVQSNLDQGTCFHIHLELAGGARKHPKV